MSDDNDLQDQLNELKGEHEELKNRVDSTENTLAAAVGNLRKHLAAARSIGDVINALKIFAGHFGGMGRGKGK